MGRNLRDAALVLLLLGAVIYSHQADRNGAEILEDRLNAKTEKEREQALLNGEADDGQRFNKWTPPTLDGKTPIIAKDPEAPGGAYQNSEYEKTRQYYDEQNQNLKVEPNLPPATKRATEHENPAAKGKEGPGAQAPRYKLSSDGKKVKGPDGDPIVIDSDGSEISKTEYARKYGDLTGSELDAPGLGDPLGGDGDSGSGGGNQKGAGTQEGPDQSSSDDAEDTVSEDEKDNLFDLETGIKETLDKLKEDLKEEQSHREEQRADFEKRFQETFNNGKASQEVIQRRLSTLKDRSQNEAQNLLKIVENEGQEGLGQRIDNEEGLCSALEDRFKTVLGDHKFLKFWSAKTKNMCYKDATGAQRDNGAMVQSMTEGFMVGQCQRGLLIGDLDFKKDCEWELTFYVIPSNSEDRDTEDTIQIELNGQKFGPFTNTEKAEVKTTLPKTSKLHYQFLAVSANADPSKHMSVTAGKAQCKSQATKDELKKCNNKIREGFKQLDDQEAQMKMQFSQALNGFYKEELEKFKKSHITPLGRSVSSCGGVSKSVNEMQPVPDKGINLNNKNTEKQAGGVNALAQAAGALEGNDVNAGGEDDNILGNLLGIKNNKIGGNDGNNNHGASEQEQKDMKSWMTQALIDNQAFIKLIKSNRDAARDPLLNNLKQQLELLENKSGQMKVSYDEFIKTLPKLSLDQNKFTEGKNGPSGAKISAAYDHLKSLGATF